VTNHPEIIPETSPYNNFNFSVKAGLLVKQEIETQLSTLQDRIEKIASNVLVGEMPMVKFVLQTSHDKNELKKFAKAIDRVADLIEAVDQLEGKVNIINAAQKDPEWFAFAFGDFSKEIDDDIAEFLNK